MLAADFSGEFALTTSQTGITATTAIGTKSFCGSYCTLSFISGAMVIGAAVVNINVEPSAGERATAAAAIWPAAPPRFSSVKGWPRFSARRLEKTRPRISVAPPAPNGTTTLTGARRVGLRPEPACKEWCIKQPC